MNLISQSGVAGGAGHMSPDELREQLSQRLGSVHAKQRLGIESELNSQVLGDRHHRFHLENWQSAHALIRGSLRIMGLYRRGQRNALNITQVNHPLAIPHLPEAFAGFRILHLSDLHIDLSAELEHKIVEAVRRVDYDLCVLTGDYRFRTRGSIEATLDGMARLRQSLPEPVYAVLGNHDSVLMVPELERMGIHMLMNEHVPIRRQGEVIYLAGIDDAHFFGVGSIQSAMAQIPENALSILLSHTPEVYRQAAHAGVDLMLSGHTHGGQICLPGRIPVLLEARLPRHMGRGAWRYQNMAGYTSPGAGCSIVAVRYNCAPEITLHTLHRDL